MKEKYYKNKNQKIEIRTDGTLLLFDDKSNCFVIGKDRLFLIKKAIKYIEKIKDENKTNRRKNEK